MWHSIPNSHFNSHYLFTNFSAISAIEEMLILAFSIPAKILLANAILIKQKGLLKRGYLKGIVDCFNDI